MLRAGIGLTSALFVVVAACTENDNLGLSQRRGGSSDYGPAEAATNATSPPPATTEPPAPTPTPTPDAGPAEGGARTEVQVSALPFTETNGYGPVEKNMSNGEDAANDGKPMSLDGTTFATGLGVHAPSKVTIALGMQYKTFLAEVGIDDEVMDQGSVVFQVVLDGVVAYDSGKMTGATARKSVMVDVTGKQQMELVVGNADDGDVLDHADWANARLVK
jgi:hypothetical protein